MSDYLFSQVERILGKYDTRNPYQLLNDIGAVTVYSNEYSRNGLMGYSTILNRTMYAVVNAKLNAVEKKVAAGHEAAHLILHKDAILASPVKALRDFNFFDNSGRYEREANLFLADFLLEDEYVMEVVKMEYMDYFGAARELGVPAPLLSFKLFSMTRRGYKGLNSFDLDSKFLSRKAGR